MKNLAEVRRHMAEKGIEYTPSELAGIVKELHKLQRRLLRGPDLSDLNIVDKQSVCRQMADDGVEISPDELDELIAISTKVRAIDFNR